MSVASPHRTEPSQNHADESENAYMANSVPIQKPFLKWAGAKTRLVQHLKPLLPLNAGRFVEPFVGAGALFLNTNYPVNILADSNADLVSVYRVLKDQTDEFISWCERLFAKQNNTERRFYALRNEFNSSDDVERRAVLFIYLNRHCYNGLCRYNKSGGFNTPFGRYEEPYFPRKEMLTFAAKLQTAQIKHQGFKTTLVEARKGDVVYCDPPYVPLSATANFTGYAMGGFSAANQDELANSVVNAAKKGAFILVSNHDTPATRKLYSRASQIVPVLASRTISCDGENRKKEKEIIAVFSPNDASGRPLDQTPLRL
jgi:DNA adenine methylase